ncbi:RNA polymerase ADP-ribosylase [Edwardsiella phage PEi20]|uniref:NAD--protein ADP-ribosyltransferase modB n=1 Tax=Edwardsiella phage PEi20 TaxID=1608310 RepID=A0A0B6VSK7_9CAUD|nr:RNA polymerase ADP-ribosylase [Edwardsiella phage PEi20]BAQ22670.1 ADP-ribosylase [Edwardsiella phage PEi20]
MLVKATNVETNHPIMITIPETAYQAVLKAHTDSVAEEEKERLYIQERVDAKFTDQEQSTLWLCMNDKNEDFIHDRLNPIVRKHMNSTVPVELYRGVSRIERMKLEDLAEGDEFTLDRVTSFSSDFATAKQFAGRWHYDSNIILSMRNCPWAYNYQEDIINIVLGAPDEEYMGLAKVDEQRADKLDMVTGECEFMLPSEARYRIIHIEDQFQTDPNAMAYTIIHLELIEW